MKQSAHKISQSAFVRGAVYAAATMFDFAIPLEQRIKDARAMAGLRRNQPNYWQNVGGYVQDAIKEYGRHTQKGTR